MTNRKLPEPETLLKLAQTMTAADIGREYGVTRQAVSLELHKAQRGPKRGWIETRQAAEILGIPIEKVRNWTANGILKRDQPLGPQSRIYVNQSEVENLKAKMDQGYDPVADRPRPEKPKQEKTHIYLPTSDDERAEIGKLLTAQERLAVLRRAAEKKRKERS